MRIAIFGGRFDPVHNGHLAVAQEVLKVGAAQEVWLSLENQHQWRPIVALTQDRKKMVELAIESANGLQRTDDSKEKAVVGSLNAKYSRLKIDTTPLDLRAPTATIFVMRELRKKFPEHDFVFVVGSDNMNVFYKWTHWEELLKEVHFLVIARKGSPIENVPKNATVITDPTYEPLEDSATRIRELVKKGKSITGLVPEVVENYIIEHGLYSY